MAIALKKDNSYFLFAPYGVFNLLKKTKIWDWGLGIIRGARCPFFQKKKIIYRYACPGLDPGQPI